MFTLFAFASLFLAVAALIVPRVSQPASYDSSNLEPYAVYHARYIALGCQANQGTQFFTDCCHPLLANQSIDTRPASCNSAGDQSSTPSQATGVQPDTSGEITGGVATFFYQNGVAGACGTVHRDTDLICALDVARYGDTGRRSGDCGRSVRITNTRNGNSVTAVIADACPTCLNGNSLDLSQSAFERLASLEEGEIPIEWLFL